MPATSAAMTSITVVCDENHSSRTFAASGSWQDLPRTTAATAQAANPFPSATNVPLNTFIQVEYSQRLLAATVNSTNGIV